MSMDTKIKFYWTENVK